MPSFFSQAEIKLRDLETKETFDLFAIGYVIPQIALSENIYHDQVAADNTKMYSPFEVLQQEVEKAITVDNLSEEDQHLVRELLDTLNQSTR